MSERTSHHAESEPGIALSETQKVQERRREKVAWVKKELDKLLVKYGTPDATPEKSADHSEDEAGASARTELVKTALAALGQAYSPDTQPVPIAAQEAAKNENEKTQEVEPLILTFARREAKASYRSADEPSEDYIVTDSDNHIYGVFDGMGGAGGRPDMASRVAAEATRDSLARHDGPMTRQEITDSLFAAVKEGRDAVAKKGEGGSTVGTIVKFLTVEGRSVMAVAHAGDTRLLAYRKSTGKITEITPDQSDGNLVFNSFSPKKAGHAPDNYSLYAAEPDLRFMLCSDGITGDWEDQKLTEDEMKDAFSQDTPDACAERFMAMSKKDDDKSIVVIDVESA